MYKQDWEGKMLDSPKLLGGFCRQNTSRVHATLTETLRLGPVPSLSEVRGQVTDLMQNAVYLLDEWKKIDTVVLNRLELLSLDLNSPYPLFSKKTQKCIYFKLAKLTKLATINLVS